MPRKSELTGILRRGSACLSCRRRKLRCDGSRPVCQQCTSMKRGHECKYDDSARKSHMQTLREKRLALEAKLRQLEDQPGSSSRPPSSISSDTPSPRVYPYEDLPPRLLVDSSSLSYQTDPAPWHGDGSNNFDSLFSAIPPSFPFDHGFDALSSNSSPSTSDVSISVPLDSVYDVGPPDRLLREPKAIQKLSPEIHKALIHSFIEHRKQYCFYSNPRRFELCSSATVYTHNPPNPSLINAVYLLGSFFARTPLPEGLEQHLLEQTLHAVSRCLHNQEQLMDVVQAQTLLAQYFFFNNRGMEGNRHLSAAKRMAVDLGLHQVSHPALATFPFDLDYPFDPPLDWREKAAVFWQMFVVEKFWSASNDCSIALPEIESPCRHISTPLPVVEGAETETTIRNSPIHALFTAGADSFHGSSLSVTAFKIMASCIFDRSLRIYNTTTKDNATWAYHRSAEGALLRLSSLVPQFTGKDPRHLEKPYFDTDLYTIHMLILASAIHLHLDNIMNLKISLAAKKLVELVNHLGKDDYHFLDPALAVCWFSIIKVFRRMIEGATRAHTNGQGGSNTSYAVAFLRRCVDILFSALRTMNGCVPIANGLIANLNDAHAPLYPGLTKTLPSFSGAGPISAPPTHGVVDIYKYI